MKLAISQPTYLPWIGYLDIIDQVDVFVALDNVQYAKRSWQQRNRIKTATGLHWLTVPVKSQGRFEQRIDQVEIINPLFVRDHLRAMEHAYRRSPFFDRYFGELQRQLSETTCPPYLADLNIRLLKWIMEVLGVRVPVIRASALQLTGKRTELLVNICKTLGARQYLSALGSAAYLLDERQIFTAAGIEVKFQNFEHPVYPQVFTPFEPLATVLDLIFNTGESALSVLRSGRRQAYSIDEAERLQARAQAMLMV